METWGYSLLLLLLLTAGYLIGRLRQLIGVLNQAAKESRPMLLERRDWLMRIFGYDRLVTAYNEILAQNRSAEEEGQGYFEQIQTTLGNLREAVVMVDTESRICMANPAFRQLARDLNPVGKRLDSFILGAEFQQFCHDLRTGDHQRRREIDVLVQQKRRWLEISAAQLSGQGAGNGQYTLFVIHDITRQKGLEKMRTEFVANASHELRTPVTIIKGFADTLIEDDGHLSAEEQRRFLKKIAANSERLHLLLQDLLYLSRLEAAETFLTRERCSLRGLVKEHAENWRAGQRNAGRIRYEFADGGDIVALDTLHFSQVIHNLLDNIQRHARGYTEIVMRTRLEKNGVRLWIIDDGVGIPEKDLPHIFQRFYRVEKGRSRELGGTGLGLSIVKHIVQEHGGEIAARNNTPQGAVIEIYVPFEERVLKGA